jgi:hypothetical protein
MKKWPLWKQEEDERLDDGAIEVLGDEYDDNML